jgi:HD-like signal output (HDOD) protein
VEEIATAGLLHDIGKVIIGLKCTDEMLDIRHAIETDELYILEAERQILDTDHAEVGGWLAKSWYLPDKLSEPISFHHNLIKSDSHRVKAAVVHFADVLIKASAFGDSGDPYVPMIDPLAWEVLKLDEKLVEDIVAELEDKLIEVKNFSLEMQIADATEA